MNEPLSEPRTNGRRRFAKLVAHAEALPFRRKLALLSVLSAAALGGIIVLNVAFGALNSWQLSRVQYGHDAVEITRDLQERLAAVHQTFHAAIKARDALQLGPADTLVRRFRADAAVLRDNPTLDGQTIDSIETAFGRYVTAGRWSAQQLAGDASSDTLVRRLDEAGAARATLLRLLAEARTHSTLESATAARRASRLLWIGWAASFAVAGAALALLLQLFRVVTGTVMRSVTAAALAARQAARGELTVIPDAVLNDELGQLQHAMHQMNGYLREMADLATAIARGDLSNVVQPRSDYDAFGRAFAAMTMYLRGMAETANAIAAGDLTTNRAPVSGDDAFGRAFQSMTARLTSVITEIHCSTDAITAASEHLTEAAQRLSEAVAIEAERIRRTEARVTAVTALIRDNADASERAGALTAAGAERMAVSSEAVRDAIAAFARVSASVSAIHAMSEESHLLALNAAIEAARVGEHGRGFAVVAQGMRTLADGSSRSASAAQEITADGSRVAQRAGAMVSALVPAIQETATLVQSVTRTSATQAIEVQGVSADMRDVAAITSANAENAEQLAATAEELSAQAEVLRGLVGFFRVGAAGSGGHDDR